MKEEIKYNLLLLLIHVFYFTIYSFCFQFSFSLVFQFLLTLLINTRHEQHIKKQWKSEEMTTLNTNYFNIYHADMGVWGVGVWGGVDVWACLNYTIILNPPYGVCSSLMLVLGKHLVGERGRDSPCPHQAFTTIL